MSATVEQAVAAPLQCGDTVTKDTTLQGDLTCDGDGLIIGAEGITLDLNGHTIAATCDFLGCPRSVGVDNRGGYDRVRIRNGAIRNFGHDVELVGARRNALVGLQVSGGDPAILLSDSDRNTIADSSVAGGVAIRQGGGLALVDGSDENRVLRSALDGESNAMLVADSTGNVLRTSRLSALIVLGAATNTRVVGNTLNGGRDAAVLLVRADENLILRNRIETGVDIDGDANVVAYNDVTPPAEFGPAIRVAGGDGNRVRRNHASFSAGDAVLSVEAAATETVVAFNLATFGQDAFEPGSGDGIRVDAPGTLIRGNIANDNEDLGIEAVAGVVDGGGNHASGNGNPLQCVNVVCTP